MSLVFHAIDYQSIQALRLLAIDMVEKAKSGHPGLPMGAAPMAYILWRYHLRYAPTQPHWCNRDRFVLSAGHGSALLYSLLHLFGYDLTLNDLQQFRQLHSRTPGHPEYQKTPGVEATTGPLGQGAANAVGMAITERHLAQRFNLPGFDLINHYTFAILSDGDVMEGVVSEAASLAGHLQLGKLIYLYDANHVTLDGALDICFSEQVKLRFEAYGFQVLQVENADNDLEAIHQALCLAKQEIQKPSLLILHTTIGFGSPHKAGLAAAHGSPLGPLEAQATKQLLYQQINQHPRPDFSIAKEVLKHCRHTKEQDLDAYKEWQELFQRYQDLHPEQAQALKNFFAPQKPLPIKLNCSFAEDKAIATRQVSHNILQQLHDVAPSLFLIDADLSSSTMVRFRQSQNFTAEDPAGRNLPCGIREHAMAAIANGISYHGGLRAVTSTFLVFADYMRPSIRLAAMNHLAVIYVWTHDSVAVGEDGPTHQPVEHLASLRAIPHLTVIRPADAYETLAAWQVAMEHLEGPVALILSRQALPVLQPKSWGYPIDLKQGAYILKKTLGLQSEAQQAILIASGSEVHIALNAQEKLQTLGISSRVVSMPSWELFEKTPQSYQDTILPPHCSVRVAIEAGVPMGWEKWLGSKGQFIGLHGFGLSGPAAEVLNDLGLHPEAVVQSVLHQMNIDASLRSFQV